MQDTHNTHTLWQQWEATVLQHGFDAEPARTLRHELEQLEQQQAPDAKTEHPEDFDMGKAHRMFDQWVIKTRAIPHSGCGCCSAQPGQRVMKTRFGAIYESSVSVKGIERLMQKQDTAQPALRLKDGFYHVNNLPGVQPSASANVNARNKNVERVDIKVVEDFVKACHDTGMNQRGWKKSVNQQFDMSRQEFSKWLERYFPCFGLPVPIARKK